MFITLQCSGLFYTLFMISRQTKIFQALAGLLVDMLSHKSLFPKGKKSVTIRTSRSEKRNVPIVFTVAADGFILPPMILFRIKTNYSSLYVIRTFMGTR